MRLKLIFAFIICPLLVVLLGMAYLLIESHTRQVELVEELKTLGVQYHYDWFDEYGWARFGPKCKFETAMEKLRSSSDSVNVIIFDDLEITEAMLNEVSSLPMAHECWINKGSIQSGGKFPGIKRLHLHETKTNPVTLTSFPNIQLLSIDSGQLDDTFVDILNSIASLRNLNVNSVTPLDNIVNYLLRLQHIKRLRLTGEEMNYNAEEIGSLSDRFDLHFR